MLQRVELEAWKKPFYYLKIGAAVAVTPRHNMHIYAFSPKEVEEKRKEMERVLI